MSTTTQELLTIGYLCSILQESPQRLTKRLAALGIQPVIAINGIAHFDGSVVDQLRSPLKRTASRSNEP